MSGPESTRSGPPVMGDVAKHAGVSLGTVSNVLNNPAIVSDRTREKVERAIAELGFRRNSVARSLAVGRADTIGFAVVDLSNSLFVDIARGAERLADERGYRVLLANSDVDLAKQDSSIAFFEESRIAGVLLAPLDAPLDAAIGARARGLPVVAVNWPAVEDGACGVGVDETHGGYLAARHLIERGRRRLLFAGGPLGLSAIASRLAGARAAVAEAGGVTLDLLETERITVPAGVRVGHHLAALAPADRPDGLVAAADALAAGAMQALLMDGVGVPGDIAVIGYDDNHFASDHIIPISTVGQPGVEMGRLAATLLIDEIEGAPDHEHRTVVLRPRLIERASTA